MAVIDFTGNVFEKLGEIITWICKGKQESSEGVKKSVKEKKRNKDLVTIKKNKIQHCKNLDMDCRTLKKKVTQRYKLTQVCSH